MNDQNDYLERAVMGIQNCLNNGAWMIATTYGKHYRPIASYVNYETFSYAPVEGKYQQGDTTGIEHFICEKVEDVVRAVRERLTSDKWLSEVEIVRRVRTRMIDGHELVEWYVYLVD